MSDPFIGQIIMFGGNFAPRSWAFCNGQLLSISQNTALFSILGTTYGGDGRTTFGLPEMRGRVAVHSGNNSAGPGLTPRPLGQRSGAETTTRTLNQLTNHSHNASSTSTMRAFDGAGNETAAEDGSLANGNQYNTGAPDVNMHANAVTTTTTNAATGGSQSANNMQPYMAVNYIIALFGTFPSRS